MTTMWEKYKNLRRDTKVAREDNSKESTHVTYIRDNTAINLDFVRIGHHKLSTEQQSVLHQILAHSMKEGDKFPVRVDEAFRKDNCLYRLVIDLDWDQDKGPEPDVGDFVQ